VVLTADQCLCDPHPDEPPALGQLQLGHREQLRQRPHRREYFDARADLCRRIATIRLAVLLQMSSDLAEAEFLYWRTLAIDEAAYGLMHPTVAIRLNNLGLLLRVTNRLAAAEPLMRRHVSIFKHFNDSTGHEHLHWQEALANYSGLLQAMGLSQEEIAQQLQDVVGCPASHSESP
jgi:hypothetical protein